MKIARLHLDGVDVLIWNVDIARGATVANDRYLWSATETRQSAIGPITQAAE